MALSQNYAAVATVGTAILQVGDVSRVAPITFGTIFSPATGGTNSGGQIERITMIPIGSTTASIVRIFRFDGTTAHLYAEIPVLGQTASGLVVNTATMLEAVDNPNMFPILVPPMWTVRATINDTQLIQEASLVNIAAAQTTAGAAQLTLNGAGVVASSNVAIAAAQAATSGTAFTLTASPYILPNPALITITSGTNVSTVGYRISGRSPSGAPLTELLTGPNNGRVYSTNVYGGAFSVVPNSTNAGTASVGYSSVVGVAIMPSPSPIVITSNANLSAVNYTITGMSVAGVVLSEVLAGPNVSSVSSVNNYAAVFTIATSAASGTVTVGTPAILGGVKIQAEGGSY